MPKTVAFALAVLISISGPQLFAEEVSTDEVQSALRRLYPNPRIRDTQRARYADAGLIELRPPSLRRALPGHRFFCTKLETDNFEYFRVEIVVVAWKEKGIVRVIECLSPIFTSTSRAFCDHFKTIRTSSRDEQSDVATDIAKLFAEITHRGEIRNTKLEGGMFQAELWHGELHWRQILITFADSGQIQSVTLRNPRDDSPLPATQP
jgi:hypothetical protein